MTEQISSGSKQLPGRAVVIGGSVAGSLAAAVLRKHFAEVLVIDRDTFPDGPEPRKGAPQGYHFHGLLAGGRDAIDTLLPGFTALVLDAGGHSLSVTGSGLFRRRCGWMPRFDSDLEVIMASRALFEWAMRKLAQELDGVRYAQSTSALQLLASDGKVTGVRIRDDASGVEEDLDAALVVDASGRASKAAAWLEQLGYPRPAETSVNAHWGYSSVFVKVPEDWDPGFRFMYTPPLGQGAPSPGPGTRGCAMWVQEGDRRWILTVQGAAGDYPPSDETALRDYLASIGVPEVDDALAHFEFESSIHVWRDTVNRLRDYANLAKRPENFIVLGDAAAAFNPVYGQGMTMAAFGATTLAAELDDFRRGNPTDLSGFAERFQKQLEAAVQYCWTISTGQDYGVAGVEVKVDGAVQEAPTGAAEFADRLVAYVARRPELYLKFMRTTQLVGTMDWMQSEEMLKAIQDDWDELGKITV